MYICIIKYKEQERNMTSLTIKEATDSYWALIKDAGYEVKLALIKRLSDALKPAVAGKKNNRKNIPLMISPVCGTMRVLWMLTS